MFATAILVFREVLEAALIISIVCAATRGLPGRGRWVSAGIGLGVPVRCCSRWGPTRSPMPRKAWARNC